MSYKLQIETKPEYKKLTKTQLTKLVQERIASKDFSEIKCQDSKQLAGILAKLKQVAEVRKGQVGYAYGMGGTYGYGYTCYLKSDVLPLVSLATGWDKPQASINTEVWIDTIFGDVDETMQAAYDKFVDESDGTADVSDFISHIGLYEAVRDNTYNYESDLDSAVVYSVATSEGALDWVYQGKYIFIEIHQGGDVRGNYGSVRVYKLENDLHSFLTERCVSWCFETEGGDDTYQSGYTNNPTYRLGEDIIEWRDIGGDRIQVTLEDGTQGVMYPTIYV